MLNRTTAGFGARRASTPKPSPGCSTNHGAANVTALAAVWALALIVLGAMVCNKFTARKTALFALWLALPIVLLAVIVYVIAIRG